MMLLLCDFMFSLTLRCLGHMMMTISQFLTLASWHKASFRTWTVPNSVDFCVIPIMTGNLKTFLEIVQSTRNTKWTTWAFAYSIFLICFDRSWGLRIFTYSAFMISRHCNVYQDSFMALFCTSMTSGRLLSKCLSVKMAVYYTKQGWLFGPLLGLL